MDAFESKVREMLETYRAGRGDEITHYDMIAVTAFRAAPYAALSSEKVTRIGCAIQNVADVDVSAALTRMVRAKTLRTRNVKGVRHYFVNV